MRRLELFEIHDHPLCPAFLRDMFTDALQAIWDFSNSYRPILPLLQDALVKAGIRDVLDLCSGAGGPWLPFVREFEKDQCFPISVRLTDKHPNERAFESDLSNSNAKIAFESRPVLATEVPSDLKGFRTIFSSFHHFKAIDASKVLANAVEHGRGIAIFETAQRRPDAILAVCFIPFLILVLTPRIRPFRWSRLLWTYVFPLVPFMLWFDGWMSCMRSYSREEIRELVRGLPGNNYRWELGTQRDGLLPVTYLIGYPARKVPESHLKQ